MTVAMVRPRLLLFLFLLLPLLHGAAAFVRRSLPGRSPRRHPRATTAAPGDNAGRPPTGSAFIFGLGYVGQQLAKELRGRGWQVHGTSTKPRPGDPEVFAFDPVAGRLLDAEGLRALEAATHLLVSIPPLKLSPNDGGDDNGDGDAGAPQDAVLACFGHELRARCPRLRWVGYLSSTSIYGDRGGGWVAEADPLAPVSPQGRARERAEAGWRALLAAWGDQPPPPPPPPPSAIPGLSIFRLAGIYGPGRSALDTLLREVARLQEQEEEGEQEKEGGRAQAGAEGKWRLLRLRMDGERLVSRIHVDDIVRVLRCAMEDEESGMNGVGVRVYNLADDRPASRLEVFSHAARLINAAAAAATAGGEGRMVQVMIEAEERAAAAGGGGTADRRRRRERPPESKRVDNARMKEEVLARCLSAECQGEGKLLLYKDFVAGLAAIWAQQHAREERAGSEI